MRLFKQLFWIFLFVFIGEIVSLVLSAYIVLPGSVVGMVLLMLCLHFKVVKIEQVDTVGTWLTDNMAIFFVPSGVALMTRFELLRTVWWQLIVVILITTVLTLSFVAILVNHINKKAKVRLVTSKENSTKQTTVLKSKLKGDDGDVN